MLQKNGLPLLPNVLLIKCLDFLPNSDLIHREKVIISDGYRVSEKLASKIQLGNGFLESSWPWLFFIFLAKFWHIWIKFDDFFKMCHVENLWKIIKSAKNLAKIWQKTHFTADSEYAIIRLQIPDPSLEYSMKKFWKRALWFQLWFQDIKFFSILMMKNISFYY